MDKKPEGATAITPIRRIAQELAPHSALTEDEIERSMRAIIVTLRENAEAEIERDDRSKIAEETAMQFLAFTELMTMFGGSLLAYDESAVGGPVSKDRMSN